MNDNLSTNLCRYWSSFITMGIFLVILGSLAISSVTITTLVTVFFLGALLVAGGLSYVIHALWTTDWKNFFAQSFIGLLAVIAGILMLTNPHIGAASLTLVLAFFFVASGGFRIMNALFTEVPHRLLLIISGIASLLLGIIITSQWPTSSLWTIGIFIGIDMIIGGWINIMYGLALRKRCSLEIGTQNTHSLS